MSFPRGSRTLVAVVAMLAATASFCGSHLRAPGGGDPDRTVFAAVHDNVLLPIARLDGARWLNTWPKEEDTQVPPPFESLPISWLGGVVPRVWFLWSQNGDLSGAAQVHATTRESGCEAPPALRLAESVPATSRIAIAGDLRLMVLSDVERSSVDGQRLTAFIDRTIDQRLDTFMAAYRFKPSEDRSLFERHLRATPLVVTALLRLKDETTRPIWFFEAERMVEAASTRATGVRLSAWIRQEPTGLVVSGAEGAIVGGDSQGRSEVLGVVKVGSQNAWFLHRIGYEGSEYVVFDVTSSGASRLVAQYAGGC